MRFSTDAVLVGEHSSPFRSSAENHLAENTERPSDVGSTSHSGNQQLAKCNLPTLGQNDGHTSAQG